ncbi:MAG: DUF2066 domain-containing protein [Proteobacteria bacterium]|nr:DUF2066 domain-containing protein [Pseudomonadota bacterium]
MQIEMTQQGRLAGPAAGICNRPRALSVQLAIGLVALSLCAAAAAVEMNSLYTVEVPLDANDPDAQNLAYQTALTEVLVRVTGTTAIAESGQIAELFPNPVRYVRQYQPGADDTLLVSFDGAAIENVLRQAGAPLWGHDRPLTMIWIAVDWGQGEREIVAADDPQRVSADARSIDRNRLLRERVAAVAGRRGIPVLFPLLDIEDLENISFSDIWGGFDDLLLQASARYGAESVLVGRIRTESLQMNRWTWYFGDERANWNGETGEIINLLADSLAARFVVDSRSPMETIRLTISGIGSVDAFGQVQRFVENLRGIDEIMIDTVAGDRIVYKVRIQGGMERLQRALELSNVLELVDPFSDGVEVVPLDDDRNPFDLYDSYGDFGRQPATLEFLYRSG